MEASHHSCTNKGLVLHYDTHENNLLRKREPKGTQSLFPGPSHPQPSGKWVQRGNREKELEVPLILLSLGE